MAAYWRFTIHLLEELSGQVVSMVVLGSGFKSNLLHIDAICLIPLWCRESRGWYLFLCTALWTMSELYVNISGDIGV